MWTPLPHEQIYQPPAAGVSSADCWLKPDLCHNPLMQEALPPEAITFNPVWNVLCIFVSLCTSDDDSLTSESQKSKSLMPVLKFCCLLASLSFWLFSADLLTRNCHCSSRALRRAWRNKVTFQQNDFHCTTLMHSWCYFHKIWIQLLYFSYFVAELMPEILSILAKQVNRK